MRVKMGSMKSIFSHWEQAGRQYPMGIPVSVVSKLLILSERMISDMEGRASGRMLVDRRLRIRGLALDARVDKSVLSEAVSEAWGREWVLRLNLGTSNPFPDPMVETISSKDLGRRMRGIILEAIESEDGLPKGDLN